MNTRLLFLFGFLFVTILASAQDLPKIVSPSPNSASIAQHVEVPVSHYTGLPNIGIPLYTISSGSVQVPISLSYHARGVKVSELASSYGLGWSLNAGGVITRQIRGNADDTSHGYLNQTYYDTFFTSSVKRNQAYSQEINGNFDRMPDQFVFNFLGFNGKFIFDRLTNKPILQTFDDLAIEMVGDSLGIDGFVITDLHGTEYHFGQYDAGGTLVTATETDQPLDNYTFSDGIQSEPVPSTISNRTTSWYLLKIIPLTGDQVTFSYEVEYAKGYRKTEEAAEKVNNDFVKTAYFSEVNIVQQKIKKIDFSQGEVNFNYNTTRNDLKPNTPAIPATALTDIEVKNSLNQRIKKYVFNYVYTTSTNSSNIINHLNINAPEAKKRLFLNSVKEQGIDNSYLPPHKFTYDSIVLPSRFSSSHDKWGYYNGKNNGVFSVFTDDVTQIGGSTIDTVKVQAGLLKKIEYPTGGSSEYEYESNRAVFPSHLEGHIAFGQNNPTVTKQVSVDKDQIYYDLGSNTYSIPFTVGNILQSHSNGSGTILTSVQLFDPDCINVEHQDCTYTVRIYNANNTVYAILHKTSTSTNIYPGNYILKVTSNDPNEDPNDGGDNFGVSLKWEESVESELEIIYTGGNRIKRTLLKDGRGNTIEKNYEYTLSSGLTSGKVFALPSYYGYGTLATTGENHTIYHHVLFRPANKLTLEQGNHGGYSFVTEYIGNKSNNIGKNEYMFTTQYDAGDYYMPPYHLPNNNEWIRGKLLMLNSYKNDNGTYNLIRSTENTYESFPFSQNPKTTRKDTLVVFNNLPQLHSGTFDSSNAHNEFKRFYLNSGSIKLKTTEVFEYIDNQYISNFTEYFYDYDNHYQVKKIKTRDSKGNSKIQEITYPQDKTTLTSSEQTLKTNHQFNILESFYFQDNNNNLIEDQGERLNYTYTNHGDNFINGLVLPNTLQTSKDSNLVENRIVYHDYDINGNLLEVSKKDGTHVVYIYGYNEALPIAKIENATSGELTIAIASLNSNYDTLTEIQSLSDADDDRTTTLFGNEGALRVALAALRAALPTALVTTYTYDPLIGVTSVTDPRGYATYYEYDEFNRLKTVRDADSNLISDHRYKYKNQ